MKNANNRRIADCPNDLAKFISCANESLRNTTPHEQARSFEDVKKSLERDQPAEIYKVLAAIAGAARQGSDTAIRIPRIAFSDVVRVRGGKVLPAKESEFYSRFIVSLSRVDANRIGQCRCGRIYWATRSGKKFCSDACRSKANYTPKSNSPKQNQSANARIPVANEKPRSRRAPRLPGGGNNRGQ